MAGRLRLFLSSGVGSCHCGAVKWTVRAPEVLECIKCNCSICKKKSNDHYIVTKERFTLLQGEENLVTYTFNTHQAKHRFCGICGVQSFYVPRSNPDCIGVMPHCIDSPTVKELRFSTFNGQNWEEEMTKKAPVAH
ncbi:hypothetical protein RB195_013697 [Necator americanus]|uniref:CENP-V/GFA domain-containing protein n=1 Tax=Necator americanus TaxID=51031 RepID=A0ABR1DYC8_NECAM